MKAPALLLLTLASVAIAAEPAPVTRTYTYTRTVVVEELPPDPFVINVPYGSTTIGGVMLPESVAVRIDDKKVTFRGKDGRTADLAWEKIPFNLKSKLAADHTRVSALLAKDPDAATRKYAQPGATPVAPVPGTTITTTRRRAATPAPAAPRSQGLNGGSYDRTESFKDTDGDGQKFDVNQRRRLRP